MNPVLPSWFSNSAPSRVGHSKKFLTWAPLGTQGTIGHPKPSRDKNKNRKVRKSQWSNKFQLVSIATVKSYEAILWQTMKQLSTVKTLSTHSHNMSQHVTTVEKMSPWALTLWWNRSKHFKIDKFGGISEADSEDSPPPRQLELSFEARS